MEWLESVLSQIKPLEPKEVAKGQLFCDHLAKPLGALGDLETYYSRLYAMFAGKINLENKTVMVYVADNGIVEEGISSNPQVTTYQVGQNMLNKQAAICFMSEYCQANVCVVDIGCKQDLYENNKQKVMASTHNILKQPAMSRKQVLDALRSGYEKTVAEIKKGVTLFGTGEMGVGNTATSAAVISVLLKQNIETIVGYGAGLSDSQKDHKVAVLKACIATHEPFNDVLDVVAKIGGLDLLGIAGTFLACAHYQLPCVVDGVISITGLLIAYLLNEHVLDYSFLSHQSSEPGFIAVSHFLNLKPMLHLNMRLGEGTGCPLAFMILENAVYTLEKMPTFEQAKLNQADYIDIRKK